MFRSKKLFSLVIIFILSSFLLTSCDVKEINEVIKFGDKVVDVLTADNPNDNVNDSIKDNDKSSHIDVKEGAEALEGLEIHFIDVGQADSILVKEEKANILIDAGDWTGDEVVPYLEEQNIEELDLVIGTHEHADHIGQLDEVINEFPVQEVWMPGNIHSSNIYERVIESIAESDANYVEVRAGEEYDLGNISIDVLSPFELTGDYNNDSIVFKMKYGNVSFLFTGDAEISAEQKLVTEWRSDLSADVLKVGHHGSDTSTSQGFVELVRPSVSIIQAGKDNEYHHPHKAVLKRLENIGSSVYATFTHGNIILTTDGESYHVETEKDGNVVPGN